jgi:hypothetical protein
MKRLFPLATIIGVLYVEYKFNRIDRMNESTLGELQIIREKLRK